MLCSGDKTRRDLVVPGLEQQWMNKWQSQDQSRIWSGMRYQRERSTDMFSWNGFNCFPAGPGEAAVIGWAGSRKTCRRGRHLADRLRHTLQSMPQPQRSRGVLCKVRQILAAFLASPISLARFLHAPKCPNSSPRLRKRGPIEYCRVCRK